MDLPWHLYLMGILYVGAGINHFRNPRPYIRIIPDALPNPKALNFISGLAEIVLGVALCVPSVSSYAAWGIIALLIAVFPANLYMYANDKASLGMPKWLRLIRLPMQIVLILWAWCYT